MGTTGADGRELDGQEGRVRGRDRAHGDRDIKRRQIRGGLECSRTGMRIFFGHKSLPVRFRMIFRDKFPPMRFRMTIFNKINNK